MKKVNSIHHRFVFLFALAWWKDVFNRKDHKKTSDTVYYTELIFFIKNKGGKSSRKGKRPLLGHILHIDTKT